MNFGDVEGNHLGRRTLHEPNIGGIHRDLARQRQVGDRPAEGDLARRRRLNVVAPDNLRLVGLQFQIQRESVRRAQVEPAGQRQVSVAGSPAGLGDLQPCLPDVDGRGNLADHGAGRQVLVLPAGDLRGALGPWVGGVARQRGADHQIALDPMRIAQQRRQQHGHVSAPVDGSRDRSVLGQRDVEWLDRETQGNPAIGQRQTSRLAALDLGVDRQHAVTQRSLHAGLNRQPVSGLAQFRLTGGEAKFPVRCRGGPAQAQFAVKHALRLAVGPNEFGQRQRQGVQSDAQIDVPAVQPQIHADPALADVEHDLPGGQVARSAPDDVRGLGKRDVAPQNGPGKPRHRERQTVAAEAQFALRGQFDLGPLGPFDR